MRHEKYDWRKSASRWRQVLWRSGSLALGIMLVLLILIALHALPHLALEAVSKSVMPSPRAEVPLVILPLHVSFTANMIFVEIKPEIARWESLDLADRKTGGPPLPRPRSFYLGKFEVTQTQWRQVMGTDPSAFKGDDLPVDSVSWNDCQKFCEKLCDLEKVPAGTYRLPTVAERDWVCRYGITTSLPANSEASAWIGNNSGATTHPVGQKQHNAWGVFDLGGNVWEWCSDPAGNEMAMLESLRIFCGGGWDSDSTVGSRTHRADKPSAGMNTVGFRVVYVPPQSKETGSPPHG